MLLIILVGLGDGKVDSKYACIDTLSQIKKFTLHLDYLTLSMASCYREIMMGDGNRVVSVTLFTFTVGPGPYAHG